MPGGRRRGGASFYLVRTGRQWRLLPREFPPRSTVYHGYTVWRRGGVWTRPQWALRQRAFTIAGLTCIVERSIAWLNRNRRLACPKGMRSIKDYEYRAQSSETMLNIAAIRLMLNQLAPA
jgi:transposase